MKTEEHQKRRCRTCRGETLHVRTVSRANHKLHLVVSILTIGAWLWVWLFALMAQRRGRWRCVECELEAAKPLDPARVRVASGVRKTRKVLAKILDPGEEFAQKKRERDHGNNQ